MDHEDDLARARARVVGGRREPLDDRLIGPCRKKTRPRRARPRHEADEAAPGAAPLRLSGSQVVSDATARRSARDGSRLGLLDELLGDGLLALLRLACFAPRHRLTAGIVWERRGSARARRRRLHADPRRAQPRVARRPRAARASRSPHDLRHAALGGGGSQGGRPSSVPSARPGAMPEVRSASIACCRMITAATWSTMGRCFRDDLPDALSACWALTVERRSSTSRTGAPASASRWAKPIASSVEAVGEPESESGFPTTSSTTSYSSASSRMRARRRRRRPRARRSRRGPRALAGVAPGDSDPDLPDVDAEPAPERDATG